MSWPHGRSADGGVDRIPLPRTSGELWLCGKHAIGPDPEHLLARTGADLVVCLNERHELADRYPAYVAWLTANAGSRARWWPIPDLHAPPVAELRGRIDELVGELEGGRRVVVHCGAGMGRAGTLAICASMVLGASAEQAAAVVAAARPGAGPEAGAQRELVEALAAELGAGR